MAAEETRRTSTTSMLVYILITIMFATVGTIAGFRLMMAWPALMGETQPAQAQPTAIIAPRPAYQPAPVVAPAPIPGIAQNAATAQAEYDAAVRAAEPVPNVGQGERVVINERPAEERQGAGENVPTAEPVVENSGIFGSKPLLTNPQADHTCKHGQVWTERGCKNP